MSEDNEGLMELMLRCLHLKLDGQRLDTAETILDFAALCDKFDCLKPIGPVVEGWLLSFDLEKEGDFNV
ncbi:hypothetical protein BDZ85DRAFT_255438, partial [Elsinoe ampelina]